MLRRTRFDSRDEAGFGSEVEDGVYWGMSDTEMGLDVADTLCFQLGDIRRRMTRRQFILALGLHTEQKMSEAGYQVDGYDEGTIHSYEQRLETIWGRPVNRVHVLDFVGLTEGMRQTLRDRRFILALGLHTEQEMAEAGFGAYWDGSDRLIPDKGDLRDYWIEISSDKDFLGPAPSYVLIRDPVRRLCHRMIAYSISGRGQAPEKVTGVDLFYLRSMDRGTTNVPHLLAQYLFRHAEGRKSGARLSGGHFIGRLAMHFGLVSDEGLRGLQVVTRELPLIDLHELGRLNICSRFGDTWAWVAPGPERQQVAAAGAHEADEAGPAVDEGAQDVPAPAQAPPPPPPAPQPQTMS
ncbi:hypothetical protein Tco_1045926 [Tanacetum coccineum]